MLPRALFQRGALRCAPARRRLAAPKTKKSKAKKQDDEGGGRDGSYDFFKAVIDAPRRRRPRLGEDEAARNFETGRTYNKLTRAKHCAFEARLQMKLDLQQAAVATLPPDLRKRAKSLEGVPLPPLDRRFWALTPPIPGFQPEQYEDDD
mmetsp:Transcript_24623/g.75939  ORF Transcript_24623/g.75939 Transcript_24623/m.75939 type:complete len:149 (+) Transcript_24623:129-575(+)